MERGLEVKIETGIGCHLFKAGVLMGTARKNCPFLRNTQSSNSQNERSGRKEISSLNQRWKIRIRDGVRSFGIDDWDILLIIRSGL